MLTRIDLRDFKCFPLLKLPLRPLTLLSGANASGKSSVIQALVLLHQAMREHEWSSNILLNGNTMEFLRAVHTGDGLVQVLPIVVAALSAAEDSLLLIENPEANLHPAGQAHMGEFLAEVAAAGVQVILETHSDHVLNGIRRAVKQSIWFIRYLRGRRPGS